MRVSSRARLRSSASSGARRRRSCVVASRSRVALGGAARAAVQRRARAARARARSSAMSGTTRRAAAVGVDARTSAARSQSGVSCSWPTADTTGTVHVGDRAHDALVGERQQILEAAAAAREHDHVGAAPAQLADRGRDRGRRARALHVRLGDERRCAGGKRCVMRGEHVALGGSVVAGDEPDQPREARQRPLARRREQPLAGELRASAARARRGARRGRSARSSARVSRSSPRCSYSSARPKTCTRSPSARSSSQRVELAARHLHREARAVLRVLEREEHRRPALLPAQLGHLALDPERRQPLEPRSRCPG